MLNGYYEDKDDWKAFMIAFPPKGSIKAIHGQLYDIQEQIVGSFSLYYVDNPRKISTRGSATKDVDNPIPLNRFTINKESLDGNFYQQIGHRQKNLGTVLVHKVDNN